MGAGRDDAVMSRVLLVTRPSLGTADRGRRPADMMWRCHGVVITMMSQLGRSSPGSSPSPPVSGCYEEDGIIPSF